jgi:hypothetical protein
MQQSIHSSEVNKCSEISDVFDSSFANLVQFDIFHYNGPHKRQYIQQIKEVWGLDVDE